MISPFSGPGLRAEASKTDYLVYCPHLIDKETEAWRGQGTKITHVGKVRRGCQRSQSLYFTFPQSNHRPPSGSSDSP